MTFYPWDYFAYQKVQPEVIPATDTFISRLKRELKQMVISDYYGYPREKPSELWIPIPSKIRVFLGRILKNRIEKGPLIFKKVVPYKQKGRLLDIGCGAGEYLSWMRDHGWETFGAEISRAACKKAGEIGLEVFQGQLIEAQYPDEYFDVVTMWEVLEHLPNPLSALQEVNRILTEDGLLLGATPNFDSLERIVFGNRWHQIDAPRHLFLFTARTLGLMLNRAGFEIIDTSFPFFPYFFAMSLEDIFASSENDDMPSRFLRSQSKTISYLVSPLIILSTIFSYGGTIIFQARKGLCGSP